MPSNRPYAASDFVKPVPSPNSPGTIYAVQIRSHYSFGALPNFFWLIVRGGVWSSQKLSLASGPTGSFHSHLPVTILTCTQGACSRTLAAGMTVSGKSWGRADDTFGVAGVVNSISGQHKAYLNAGRGILVGDGKLTNPGAEQLHGSRSRQSLPLDPQAVPNHAHA
jgi:hypothetical protein